MTFEEAKNQIFYDLTSVVRFMFDSGLLDTSLLSDHDSSSFLHPDGTEIFFRRKDASKFLADLSELTQSEHDNNASDELTYYAELISGAVQELRHAKFTLRAEWVKAWAVSEDLAAFLDLHGEMVLHSMVFPDPIWLQITDLQDICN